MLKKIEESSRYISEKIVHAPPDTGIILGTGLGKLTEEIEDQTVVPYEDIPHFPVSTVESHSGRMISGLIAGKPVVAMQGRFHYYEGYNLKEVTFPVRVLKMLGIKRLLISNAAGSLNPSITEGSLMILRDHINLLPDSPLTGQNIDELGQRFPDMSRPYDESLRNIAFEQAKIMKMDIQQGVYVSVPGPNLETPAEYKYLKTIGADAVGMSTVPEVITARHMSLPCFAISVITDECFTDIPEPLTIEKVIDVANRTEPSLTRLMKKIVESHN